MSIDNNKITENQYIFLIHSSMIAVGILYLAAGVSNTAHQQGWISVMIGGLYPLIIVITAYYIDKKMNHLDFWETMTQIYGKFLAYIFTFVFIAFFILIEASSIAGFVNTLRFTVIPFISPNIIRLFAIFITIFTCINGLTNLGRLCEFTFYFMIFLFIIFLFIINKGNIINIKPFVSSFKEIIYALPDSTFSYTGIEHSYFIIYFISNRKNPKKAGIIGVCITIVLYTFITFMPIYLLGWEMASRLTYPTLYIATTLRIPVLEDFASLFLVLWSVIILRIMCLDRFSISYGFSKLFKINYKTSCIFSSILPFALSFLMFPECNRRKIVDIFIPYLVTFSISWGIITSIIVFFKKRGEKL